MGAVFNSALQLGSAVGIAAVNSIQTSLDAHDPTSFKGRAAALWFVLAVLIVEAISVLVFYKSSTDGSPTPAPVIAELVDVEKPGVLDGGKGGGGLFGGMTMGLDVVDEETETGKPPSTRTTTRRLTLELADVELEVHGVQPRRRTLELVDLDGGVQPRRRTIELVDLDGGVQAARRRTIEIVEGRPVSYVSDRSDDRHGERESNHSHSHHGHGQGQGQAVQRVSAVLQITGAGVGEVVPERGGTP